MTALTKDRNTKSRNGADFSEPVNGGSVIFAGAMVSIDAGGNLVPAGDAGAVRTRGVANERADATGLADGDIRCAIRKGVFAFENSAAGDAITRAEIGLDCYVVDDQTVAKTDGGTGRKVAGKIIDVDADYGVWVLFT